MQRRLLGACVGRYQEQLQHVQQRPLQTLTEGETAQPGELVDLRDQSLDQLMAGLDRLRCIVTHVSRTSIAVKIRGERVGTDLVR